MADLSAEDLYQRLAGPEPPRVLDVRNADEFARWRVEGPQPVDVLNVPYFEFVEREEASVRRVTEWLGARRGDLAVVCAEGGSSAFVAEILQGRGLPAANLAGGMAAWGLGTAIRPIGDGGPVRLWQVLRFGRGCLSYVVADGENAVVVDPHRGLDVYRRLLEREGLHLRAVFDTHLQADHVSGAPALARDAGVGYHASLRDLGGGALSRRGSRGRPARADRPARGPAHRFPRHPGSHAGQHVAPGLGRVPLDGRHALRRRRRAAGSRRPRGRVGAGPPPDAPRAAAAPPRRGRRAARPREHSRRPPVPSARSPARSARSGGENGAMRLDLDAFVREAEHAAGSAPPAYARIREINLGRETAAETELTELELGKNQCALSRR